MLIARINWVKNGQRTGSWRIQKWNSPVMRSNQLDLKLSGGSQPLLNIPHSHYNNKPMVRKQAERAYLFFGVTNSYMIISHNHSFVSPQAPTRAPIVFFYYFRFRNHQVSHFTFSSASRRKKSLFTCEPVDILIKGQLFPSIGSLS